MVKKRTPKWEKTPFRLLRIKHGVQAALRDGYTKEEVMADLVNGRDELSQALKRRPNEDDVLAELIREIKGRKISADKRKTSLSTRESNGGSNSVVEGLGMVGVGLLVPLAGSPVWLRVLVGLCRVNGVAEQIGEKVLWDTRRKKNHNLRVDGSP